MIFRSELDNNGVVKFVDRAQPSVPDADRTVDEPTRQRILELLLAHGSLTAAQLAERLELTAAGVRRHLGALSEAGAIHALEPEAPQGRGRPARRYQLTPAGRSGFGDAYDDLALSAMAELVEMVGPDAVGRVAEKRLREVEADYRRRRADQPDADPVQQLADALNAAGYFASAADDGELCQHHCPVAHVAAEFPQLCEAETHFFARLLGTDVSRSATIALGDVTCRMGTTTGKVNA